MTTFQMVFVLAPVVVGFGILAFIMDRLIRGRKEGVLHGLLAETILVAAGSLAILGFIVYQYAQARAAEKPPETELVLPDYDHAPWRALPVQHDGRHKPFETAAFDIVRKVHGRGKIHGLPAEAVVLSWILSGDRGEASKAQSLHTADWENFPFILCGHTDVRRLMFRLDEEGRITDVEPTQEQLHGKYVSPRELRQFRDRFRHAGTQGRDVIDTLHETAQNELNESVQRLGVYDNLTKYTAIRGRDGKQMDLLAFVALDKVKGAPWFSIRQLQSLTAAPENWTEELRERVKLAPQLYIPPAYAAELAEFQEQVKLGTAQPKVDELDKQMTQRREKRETEWQKRIDQVVEHSRANRKAEAAEIIAGLEKEYPREMSELEAAMKDGKDAKQAAEHVQSQNQARDRKTLDELRNGLKQAKDEGYDADDLKFRMFHLAYLENKFPDVYERAVGWQEVPAGDVKDVLYGYDDLRNAYQSGQADRFDRATQAFFSTLQQVSERTGNPYPGDEGISERLSNLVHGKQPGLPSMQLIELEMQFNKAKPFMWAWIVMFVSVLGFVVYAVSGSRLFYRTAMGLYAASLVLQMYGFFARIVLAGRPPVSNMYETVIWVAFTAGIFALILELVYRKGLIGLAGAMVAWLGLVLADNLPVSASFTSSISSIAPVLRSNFWLTIHVLVIVASYAGGALAWMLGNISLGMMTFGNPKRDVIKTLTQYNYRALQIAVLLLAAGTFLGGWWAAKSWGRFWGWDPKEVGALIALVCYVIPLHARFIGWVKDFGLAVSSVVCFSTIMMSWYGVNFILGVGLHAYAFGGGGKEWVFLVGLVNILWVLLCCIKHVRSELPASAAGQALAT